MVKTDIHWEVRTWVGERIKKEREIELERGERKTDKQIKRHI